MDKGVSSASLKQPSPRSKDNSEAQIKKQQEELYSAYRSLVLAIISQPRATPLTKISSKGVAEMMRNGYGLGKCYLINNTAVSGLAHRFVAEFPEYSTYFAFRRSPRKN